ncbi:MAG: alpha-amylase family protein [Acidobacteriota bacterium]
MNMKWVQVVALWLFCQTLVSAQDVGMGARKGRGVRFEAPYTPTIETPHVQWATSLPGAPIRLLAVPSVREGRTIVELAQRLSLELSTVTIDPEWDNNKWTMAFGEDYGARAEKGDLHLIYSYLEQELTSDKVFDAILLPVHHGWERLTEASRKALDRRVREGCGLILIAPTGGDLSPLIPAKPVILPEDPSQPVSPGQPRQTPWRRVGQHYLTRAIPVESFPFEHLSHYLYRAAPGALVLIETPEGEPVAAVHQVGKGRVIAFGYRNHGLSWHMPMEARVHSVDTYWEYFYSMLCRAVIYAAKREPAKVPDFSGAESVWRLRNEQGKILQSGKKKPPSFHWLAPGRYFVEQQSPEDWQIAVHDVPNPDRVDSVKVGQEVISEGDHVSVEVQASRAVRAELIDGFGRVIAKATTAVGGGKQVVQLTTGRPLTHSGVVRVTAGSASRVVPVLFAASSRDWTDYEIVLPWYGPGAYQPWIPALDAQFRRIGITTLDEPDRNFKIMASAHLPAFGIYWYRRGDYLKRKAAYLQTGEKKWITRDITLQKPGFDDELREELLKRLGRLLPLRPLAYYLADESSLTAYGDAYDVDWAPEALDGFRRWLQSEYRTLEDLNTTWGTHFDQWASVLPMTTEEAQRHGNYAPWSDHRVYMEREFIELFSKATRLLHSLDPRGRASFSGTQLPAPHNGCNWYEIDQIVDYLQPYSHGNQDPMHHLFRPGLLLTGFTGYGRTGHDAQFEQWQRLFYGHTGASIFWHFTLMNPDLTLSEQGEALAEAFGKIQSGIGRVFMNSKVREDGVAIHFSMASIRGAWITDGRVDAQVVSATETSKNFSELMRRRKAWVQELEKQGVQFRFLATPQIESGALKNFRVLILPYSIALSDKEVRAIEQFAKRGGTVFIDEQTGRMDERCRWRKAPPWQGQHSGFVQSGPGQIGVPKAFDVTGEFLMTVREFGESRLIGLLPKQPTTVTLPETTSVRYDLLRGGIAAPKLEASPEEPVLLVERSGKIAKLELDPDLRIRLSDERNRPVDRSVVQIQVFDPSGEPRHYYSSNVTIEDGSAQFSIPFALNDPEGNWIVRAREVVSGMVVEQPIRR